MPEGDTIRRTADVLRRSLLGETIVDARGQAGAVRIERLVGGRVIEVRSLGKHLLIGFDSGLTLHTHLGMHGAWHRYLDGERWRRRRDAAVAVLRTRGSTVVCFDAPVVELVETRALPIHPALASLGPDLLAREFDPAVAARRLLGPRHAARPVAEVLLDQSAVAGIGNVYRSELLFLTRVDPFRLVGSLGVAVVEGILRLAVALLGANIGGGARATVPRAGERGPDTLAGPVDGEILTPIHAGSGHPRRDGLWVYRRAGRPCRRCGTTIRSLALGSPPRRLYWCSTCQPRSVDPVANPHQGAG
jgi:endonuclease-8